MNAKKSRANATRSERRRAAAKRRQALAASGRPAAAAPATARPRRRGVVAGGVALAAVLVAGVVGFAVATDDDDLPDVTLLGELVTSESPAPAPTAPPRAYRVRYRIDMAAGAQTLEQELLVRRPSDVRYRFGDQGALDTPLLDRVHTAAHLTTVDTGGTEAQRANGSLPLLGNRYDVVLRDLVQLGFYDRRERRRVLGEECTVYRTGAVMESFVITRATENTYADLCITDDGIVLEEVSASSGEADMRVTAVAVEREPSLTDADFPAVTDAAALDAGGVTVEELSRTAAPDTAFWRWATPPAGWTHAARRKVEVRTSDGAAGPVVPKTSFVDLYTRGDDLLVVRQGLAGNEPEAVSLDQSVDTTLGPLGAAQIVLGTHGSMVVISDKDARFLQVSGTVPVDELRAAAALLTQG